MKVRHKESFARDLRKRIPAQFHPRVRKAILKLEQANSLGELSNIKALAGEKGLYRLRLGDYRIGFAIEANEIVLVAIGKRSDFYHDFP